MFKVGDIVKVKPKEFFLNHPNYDEEKGIVDLGFTFSRCMFEYCESRGRIKTIYNGIKQYGYCIYILEDNHFNWNDWMFEKVNKQLELFGEN